MGKATIPLQNKTVFIVSFSTCLEGSVFRVLGEERGLLSAPRSVEPRGFALVWVEWELLGRHTAGRRLCAPHQCGVTTWPCRSSSMRLRTHKEQEDNFSPCKPVLIGLYPCPQGSWQGALVCPCLCYDPAFPRQWRSWKLLTWLAPRFNL